MPVRSAIREAVLLLGVSFFLALTYNGVTEKGIFGSTAPRLTPQASGSSSASSQIITVEAAKQLFDSGAALFIDTRHAYDFRLGHIRGARNLPLKDADALIAELTLDKSKTIVVYCDGVGCNSSLEVGAKLLLAGYPDVQIFYSGWVSWQELGYPTEAEPQ